MSAWSIRHRIVASFGLLLLMMGGTALLAYTHLSQIDVETESADKDSISGLYASASLQPAWAEYQILLHRLADPQLASGATEGLHRALQSSLGQRRTALERYGASVFSEQNRRVYQDLRQADEAYQAQAQRLLQLLESGRGAEVRSHLQGDLARAFADLKTRLQALIDFDKANADSNMQQIRAHVVSTNRWMLLCMSLAAVIALLAGLGLLRSIGGPMEILLRELDTIRQGDFTQRMNADRRDEFGLLAGGFNRMVDELTGLVGQVQKSGIQVNSSVTQIAATARQQQATANEIAATTTEIGATSKEISATSRELVRTMGEVSTVADESAALAGSGRASLAQMQASMQAVMEASAAINARLTVLNERAGNIGQVVTTITKVADQTNLLSLNAAIEAEKAGEFGRGFAVVATEIRRLADQTAIASEDIEQMVKEIQSAVSASVMGMDKFSEEVRRGMQDLQGVNAQLSAIIEQVQALAPRFESVNEGMQAQAEGAEQISQALVQLSEAARQTVDSLHQSSLAIDDLNGVANGLRSGVSRFKLQQA